MPTFELIDSTHEYEYKATTPTFVTQGGQRYEIERVIIRLGPSTDPDEEDGKPYLWTDVKVHGYWITKAGQRDKRRGYVPIYLNPLDVDFAKQESVPTAFTIDIVRPIRAAALAMHPELAHLPIEGTY